MSFFVVAIYKKELRFPLCSAQECQYALQRLSCLVICLLCPNKPVLHRKDVSNIKEKVEFD